MRQDIRFSALFSHKWIESLKSMTKSMTSTGVTKGDGVHVRGLMMSWEIAVSGETKINEMCLGDEMTFRESQTKHEQDCGQWHTIQPENSGWDSLWGRDPVGLPWFIITFMWWVSMQGRKEHRKWHLWRWQWEHGRRWCVSQGERMCGRGRSAELSVLGEIHHLLGAGKWAQLTEE